MARRGFSYRTDQATRFIDEWYDRTLEAWPVSCDERRFETSCGPTFALEFGSPDAPHLVLLHPAGTNSAIWAHLADLEELARQYRVFAIDTVGDAGRSVINRKPRKNLYAGWLEEVFGALGVERPTLLGASFGGALSLTMAFERPALVNRVVAFVPPGVVCRLRLRSGVRMLLLALFFSEKRFVDFCRYANGGRLEPGQGSEMLGFLLDCSRRKIRSVMSMPRSLSDAEIKSIQAPCRCYLGEKDPFIRAEKTKQRLDALNSKVRAVVIEGVGHFLDFDFANYIARGLQTAS